MQTEPRLTDCPYCGSEIEAEPGLAECPACGHKIGDRVKAEVLAAQAYAAGLYLSEDRRGGYRLTLSQDEIARRNAERKAKTGKTCLNPYIIVCDDNSGLWLTGVSLAEIQKYLDTHTGERRVLGCRERSSKPLNDHEGATAMSVSFYEGTSTFALRALRDEKQRRLADLIHATDDPAWEALTVDQQDQRLREAERLADETGELTAELLDRLPDDDAPPPKRYVQNYFPVVAPITLAPDDPALGLMAGGPSPRTGNAKMMQFSAATPLAYGQGARTHSFADQPGIGAVRMLKSYAACHGNMALVAQQAQRMYGDDPQVARNFEAALAQGSSGLGGFLVPEQQSRDLIEYLRNVSVIRAHVRSLPFKGTMTIPSIEQGTTAQYLGETSSTTWHKI